MLIRINVQVSVGFIRVNWFFRQVTGRGKKMAYYMLKNAVTTIFVVVIFEIAWHNIKKKCEIFAKNRVKGDGQ